MMTENVPVVARVREKKRKRLSTKGQYEIRFLEGWMCSVCMKVVDT